MTTEQAWLTAAGAMALVALLLAALSWRVARRALAQTRELAARLSERDAPRNVPADAAETSPTALSPEPFPESSSYLITAVEEEPPAGRPVVAPRLEGRLFADIVARETVVKAASWTHGVRRALSPESRNRIRFQVRQQAKQSRRDRKVEMRAALREYRARQRADEGNAA